MRRLTGDEHLDPAFAATWPTYELDTKTRTLLAYAAKLTDSPGRGAVRGRPARPAGKAERLEALNRHLDAAHERVR